MNALIAASALALIHVAAGYLRGLHHVPRSIWLSGAGGVAVAYVFLHLLPEVSRTHGVVAESLGGTGALARSGAYFVALVGLVFFYGLEHVARVRSERGGVFWLHVASFGLYNAIIGYVLGSGAHGSNVRLLPFALAMGLHFLVNDYGLRHHHKERYDRVGRWLLAAAILAGWALSAVRALPEAALGLLVAFLAGGIVLNTLKEELPQERESRLSAFIAGVAAYSALELFASR